MNTVPGKMDSALTSMWVSFFTAAGIPSDVSATYALTFAENRIQNDMLLDLNKEYLRDMGISRMGDVIAILRHAKQVHENAARDRVLNSTATPKVPVAAVTGRATIAQPASPASRILEHYTRRPPAKESSPAVPAQLQKRKSSDAGSNTDSTNAKQARTIRFGSAPKAVVKEAPQAKQTVFARLGSSDATVVAPKVKTVTITKPESKPVFARLGSKTEESHTIPVPKDALRYEGILKSPPSTPKKMVTITASKNNMRKIACTMRADETPVPVKEKLALPKPSLPLTKVKSVKFSNMVQYKEIDTNQKIAVNLNKAKATQIFNKPERRLSMPESQKETSSVKERLGIKKPNNLTITRNVFNRLGV